MQGLVQEDLFKLMDDFSINDASCLIAGVSPHKYYFNEQYEEWGFRELLNSDPDNIHEAVELVKKSLCNAIKKGKLKATIVVDNYNTKLLTKSDMQADWFLTHELDVTRTTIEKTDLIEWLRDRGVYPFFLKEKLQILVINLILYIALSCMQLSVHGNHYLQQTFKVKQQKNI